jgi:hypothetical protein
MQIYPSASDIISDELERFYKHMEEKRTNAAYHEGY